MPDAAPWRLIADRNERLHTGLAAIYGWYRRNADLAACVFRDAEHHALTKKIVDLRMGPQVATYHEVLGAKLTPKQRAMLRLALTFWTWRTLVREARLTSAAAVAAMVSAIECGE